MAVHRRYPPFLPSARTRKHRSCQSTRNRRPPSIRASAGTPLSESALNSISRLNPRERGNTLNASSISSPTCLPSARTREQQAAISMVFESIPSIRASAGTTRNFRGRQGQRTFNPRERGNTRQSQGLSHGLSFNPRERGNNRPPEPVMRKPFPSSARAREQPPREASDQRSILQSARAREQP